MSVFNISLELSGNNYHIGVNFTKGIFLHLYKFYLSKDGIHHYLEKTSCSCPSLFLLLLARLIGFLEIPLFLIMFPISLIIYTTLLSFLIPAALVCSLLCPFKFKTCLSNANASLNNRQLTILIWVLVATSAMSILKLLLLLICLPLQIIVPEFTVWKVPIHKLGSPSFDYLE